jgi:uncharacterized protein YjiS (DUF1127 family)
MTKALAQGSAASTSQSARTRALYREKDSSAILANAFRTLRMWMARSRQRKALGELAELNDYLLEDIGLTREEALREAAKPFWRR